MAEKVSKRKPGAFLIAVAGEYGPLKTEDEELTEAIVTWLYLENFEKDCIMHIKRENQVIQIQIIPSYCNGSYSWAFFQMLTTILK